MKITIELGDLEKEIHMSQFEGFVVSDFLKNNNVQANMLILRT